MRDAFSEWTISSSDVDARVARAIRLCVGDYIREMYGEVLNEPMPLRIADLVRRLERSRAAPPPQGASKRVRISGSKRAC